MFSDKKLPDVPSLSNEKDVRNFLITEKIKSLGPAHTSKVLIGTGRFSKVYQVDLEDGKRFALKQIKREADSSGKHLDNIVNEVSVLLQL